MPKAYAIIKPLFPKIWNWKRTFVNYLKSNLFLTRKLLVCGSSKTFQTRITTSKLAIPFRLASRLQNYTKHHILHFGLNRSFG